MSKCVFACPLKNKFFVGIYFFVGFDRLSLFMGFDILSLFMGFDILSLFMGFDILCWLLS